MIGKTEKNPLLFCKHVSLLYGRVTVPAGKIGFTNRVLYMSSPFTISHICLSLPSFLTVELLPTACCADPTDDQVQLRDILQPFSGNRLCQGQFQTFRICCLCRSIRSTFPLDVLRLKICLWVCIFTQLQWVCWSLLVSYWLMLYP